MKKSLKFQILSKVLRAIFISKEYRLTNIFIFLLVMKYLIYVKLTSFNYVLKRVRVKKEFKIKSNSDPNSSIIKIEMICKLLSIKSCLIKSLAGFEFLKRIGLKPEIIIGVKKENHEFSSHSWLALENKILFQEKEKIDSYLKILRLT
tara:strand:- start:338 stop:781 length:444 start_codon:yes stop_codon:yes gene_type:complete